MSRRLVIIPTYNEIENIERIIRNVFSQRSSFDILVVDDSIVRGTTTPHVVGLLKKGGAREIHLRICAPPIISPCHFGVDLSTKKELIAANMSVEEIRKYVGADSLGYLSHEGLLKAVRSSKEQFCMGCFTGDYPIPVQLEMDKLILEA